MTTSKETMQSYLEALASGAPTPGGGGASAVCGALAAALGSMVANLTIGKKKYAAVEEEIKGLLKTAESCRKKLLKLADADEQAFLPLAAAYRMPTGTEEEKAAKQAAMQTALHGACSVPLEIMQTCDDVLMCAATLAEKGSVMAVSDAAAAAILAGAAVKAASLNIYINAPSMADRDKAAFYCEQADTLCVQASVTAEGVFMLTKRALLEGKGI